MRQDIIIYHGFQKIIEMPKFGIVKKYNDMGRVSTAKDLNKAQFDIVMRLAKTLKYDASDLFE